MKFYFKKRQKQEYEGTQTLPKKIKSTKAKEKLQ